MATTGTYTARDFITDAYRKINVVAQDETMDADQADVGLRALDRLLKSWQNRGYLLWSVASQTLTLVEGAAQTLDPVRPLRILSARFQQSSSELPMTEMTRDEYDYLPVKNVVGTPTQFYYDRQRESAVFYIWPTSNTGGVINITFEREVEDQTSLDAAPDVPGEWWEALVYSLAARLADNYSRDAPYVRQRAEEELRLALASDREGSVYMGDGQYAG